MSTSSATQVRVGPRSLPPFRADHVGSLLRPRELAEARAARKAGTLSPDALRAVEDRCIEAAIRKQEELGLRAATDGEYRRAYWHYDFVSGLDGVELYEPEQKIQFKGGVPLPHALRVTGRIGWTKPVMVDDFRFVAEPREERGAEDDHSVTVGGAFPRRTAGDRREDLSGYGWVLRGSRRGVQQGGGGVRRGRLPVSAAR